MQGFLVILFLMVSYLVGRAVMRAMGIMMIGSLAAVIFQPMIWGMLIVLFGIGLIVLLFKVLIVVFMYAFPVIVILGLIFALIKVIRNKR